MIRIWIAMMLALLLLAGCGGEKDAGYVARKLDIVLPQPAAVTSGDSHGGFHGDGLLHMELTGTGGAPLPGRRRRVGLAGLARASPGMVVSGGPSGERDGGYVAAVLLQLYLCGL